jgi:hypothetical protein
MKRIAWWTCTVITLIAAAALAAPAVANDEKMEGPHELQGCLADGPADGWYVLTVQKDDAAKEVRVQGDASFEDHVGHQVEVTGTWEEDDGGKYLAATALEHVAATCS